MTPRKAFKILHQAAIKNEVSDTLSDAIAVVTNHALRLEQTLQLIGDAVNSAYRSKPKNALIGRK